MIRWETLANMVVGQPMANPWPGSQYVTVISCPVKRNGRIIICVLTIVFRESEQEFTQQQKSFDIPSTQIYLARPWCIADIIGNVAFVIHPGPGPWEILNNCRI